MRSVCFVIVVGLIISAVACGATSSSEDPRDSVGWMACREWRRLIADADILTPAEFRTRLQSIEKRARYAATDGLADATRRTLQAFTNGNVAAAKEDMVFVVRVCATPAMH